MNPQVKQELQREATHIRRNVVTSVYHAKSGHPGGSLSLADIMTYLYLNKMNVDPENPTWEKRDRFVLSKGHTAPVLYSALAARGFFPEEDLKTLRKTTSYLQGHPSLGKIPGVDMSTGSLGQGISVAAGMALGAKLEGETYNVYTVLGDGELEEGEVWEAAMFAAAKGLDHLIAVVDNNGLQIDGNIEEVNSPYPIDRKFSAFGWNVIVIDGHDFDAIHDAFTMAEGYNGKPTVIIAKTIKGKGVSFMEDRAGWHGKAPNDEEYAQAMRELKEEA